MSFLLNCIRSCYLLSDFLKKKFAWRCFIVSILLLLFIPIYVSCATSLQWDNDWSYSQEIKIPFDTNLKTARFQPIDIKVDFQNPCWAKNELENSIRVCCWDGKEWHELESQIYDLEKSNGNFITSCNLVFLIPDFADGTEEYFVYYDDSGKPSPGYLDHVEIKESYYSYEPIPGYPLESYYYKILDDNYITYAVSYEGQFMGYNTCQHVTKLKEKTVEALPKNGELFAAFDFKYTYDKGLFSYSSTSQKLVSKEVLVDGNLMLEFRIVSRSKFDDLQTTATYKYYHCPTSNTRMHVHVKHEALKEIKVTSKYPASNTDGVFASLQCGGVKSRSIQELNIGRILPFMHFFNEMGTISEYKVNIDPEYIPDNPDIRLISYKDDVDLGKDAWFSFDEGETGLSHSVIFSSNDVLVSGTNEKNGLQLNAFEVDYPHLPGLENNVATIQVGRNSFETGENHDITIPEDFIAEFDAEFFSSKTDGFPIIEEEAKIFQELVKIKAWSNVKPSQDAEEIEKHNLSVFVHLAPSIPMGSTLSAAIGLDLSYISVELYRNDEYIYSRTAVRLPTKPLEELENPSFLEKIISTLKIFDLKNISIFKKAVFPKIEEGKYVVKIFRENPAISKEKQYIGYAIVDLQKDKKIHVLCGSESKIKVKIVDQNNKMVPNAEVFLQDNGTTIAKNFTNENGQATIKAPKSIKKYDLKVIYSGGIVYQDQVKLGLVEKFISSEKTIEIQRYNLNLKVTDKWGQIPEVELDPVMNIKQAEEATKIYGEKLQNGKYIFTNLTANTYELTLTFKSFVLNQEVKVSKDQDLELEFPAEYNIKLKVLDARGEPYQNSIIIVNRNNKQSEIQNQESETTVVIPPGEYQVEVYSNNNLVGSRTVGVYGEQEYDLVTNNQPIYPIAVLAIGCLLIISSLAVSIYKKDKKYFLTLLAISLFLISIFMPWWEINGSANQLKTSTKLYFIPNNMITITSTENAIAGEPSYLPDEFKLAITMIIILTIAGCVLLALNQFFMNNGKKRLRKMLKIFTVLLFIGSISVFVVAENEVCRVSIGSIIGQGQLEVGVPGESKINSVLCNWGPSIGFYIYLAAIIVLIVPFLIYFFKKEPKGKNEIEKDKKNMKTIQHPLFGISFKKWIQLLDSNGRVDTSYFARGAFITISSIVMTPIKAISKFRYESKINNTEIKNPPVFIIGHWRSGTTYLHELLSQDQQFCYVSLWNTLVPDDFLLLDPTKKFLSNFLPSERPMDSIKVDIDGPYEEEAAIAILNRWSFFHCLHFPRNAEEQYVKSIHFENLTDEEKTEWKNNYLKFMKSVTFANNGKRLLLKNPANTARIPSLLELFPNALFIHIYRNPYKVYLSTIKMRNKVLDKLALQNANKEEIEKQVIENYKRLMKSYFQQKDLIPKGNLIEICYEDLVRDPIKQARQIYLKLKLPGFKGALPGMRKYLKHQREYKTNVYAIDEKIIAHVYDNWKFTIDRWKYTPPK
jgi:omega-hydroxy-beta-dihydromenaquinone-9 sulfotransferase